MIPSPPLPEAAATGGYDAELFGRLADLEDRSYWFRVRNRLVVDLVQSYTVPGDRVLEVGCGTGYVLQALSRDCGLAVTGSELLSAALGYARARVPEASVVQLDAREMPFDAEFDLVGAFDVLEHIDDHLGALRGMRRAVRPGGCVVLTVPQHEWLWSSVDEQAHHVRRYGRRESRPAGGRRRSTPREDVVVRKCAATADGDLPCRGEPASTS